MSFVTAFSASSVYPGVETPITRSFSVLKLSESLDAYTNTKPVPWNAFERLSRVDPP